jgi:uncharacterized membrane protein YcaP (DUF421 family)
MFQSVFRSVVIYFLLICSVRLTGKRELGQLEPSELVVTMLAADLAAIPMQAPDIPLYTGVIPILVIVVLELVLSRLSLVSIGFRRIMCGKPVILIENGNILYKNLKRSRITLDELTGQLRLKDVMDIRTVRYAILETNGSLSVFPYPGQSLPVTVISDGRLMKNNLKKSGKDQVWLSRTLKKYHATQAQTLLLTVDDQNQVVFIPKEGKL